MIADLLKGCGESLFLRYKDRLDRVLYSLIRLNQRNRPMIFFIQLMPMRLSLEMLLRNTVLGRNQKHKGYWSSRSNNTTPEIAARLRTANPVNCSLHFRPINGMQLYDLNTDSTVSMMKKLNYFLDLLCYPQNLKSSLNRRSYLT